MPVTEQVSEQVRDGGVADGEPAATATAEKETTERKIRLAAAFRIFARMGFDLGVAGHITARDPVWPDRFWVNPLGRHFGRLRASDLVLVDHSGRIVAGTGPINHSAFVIHSRVHAARPDVVSVAHAHSPCGTAWSALGRRLDPISQNACVFFEDHVLFDEYSGPVMALEEGIRIAERLSGAKAAILRNHGLLTVGASVEEAAWWFVAMERVCDVALRVEAAGTPVVVDAEVAREARRVSGGPEAGRLGFRPLFEWIVAEEPDLCD